MRQTLPTAALLRPASAAVAPPPPCLAPTATLGEAIAAMSAARSSAVLAVDAAGRPLGILTEQDIARRVAFRLSPDTPLAAAMSAPGSQ